MSRHMSAPAWDHQHVRMPFADVSAYGVRRWSVINHQLGTIKQAIFNSTQFDMIKVSIFALTTHLIVTGLFRS